MSLSQIIKRCLREDEDSWGELIDYITPLILSICRKNKLSREESSDVFGQVSYMLLKNLGNIRSVDKLLHYVGTMTVREAINIYRSFKRKEKVARQTADLMYHFSPPTPEEIYESGRKSEILTGLLANLNPREYQVIKALFLEGGIPKYSEVAGRLDIPESSIGPTRARALNKLNKIIKKKKIEL